MDNIDTLIPTDKIRPGELLTIYPDLYMRVNFKGEILDFVNESLNEKYSPGVIFIGKKIEDIFPPSTSGKLYEKILETGRVGSVSHLEYFIPYKKTKKIFKARFIPLENEQVVVSIREITRSRKAKAALASYRKRMDIVWKNSTDGMRLLDKSGTIVAVNDSYCRLVGMDKEDLINKSFRVVYKGDKNELDIDFNRLEEQFTNQQIKGSIQSKIRLHNGNTKYVEVVNTFIHTDISEHTEDNEPVLLSIFKDITEQKKAQQTEKLLAEIVDSSHDAIIGNSLNGIIASWNTGAEKIFGYTKDEVKGLSVSFLIPPERSDELTMILNRVKEGEKIDNYETVCVTKNGNPIYISASVSPIKDSQGVTNGISIIARDISEKKFIEQTLRESEERYRSLVETSPDAIVLLDFDGKILMGNRLAAEMLGFISADEILGSTIFSHILKHDYFRVLRHAKKVTETGRLKNAEYELLDKNNNIIPVEISASVLFNIFGLPYAIIAVIRDISERRTAEVALRNSELQFRSVWENSNDGMRLTDENGNIIAVNRAFCSLVEIKEKNLIGNPFNIIYSSKEQAYMEESLKLYRNTFNEKNFQTHKQSRSTFTCGKTVELNVTYSIIELKKGGSLLLAIFHDITETKKVEAELRNSEKHAAIGKMAAYLSHEIKTPLASIKMNIEMLSRSLEIPKDKQKSFNIIQKEVKRLNGLLKNVLQFSSRQADLVIMNINLFNLIHNIGEFLEPSLKSKNINFISNVDHISIRGDYQKLHSVLLHMIENSIEAISENGTIEISSSVKKESKCVTIYIRDDGCGVSLPSQIFDPFFTTKASGTGLGLSIAQKIIEQHHGKIELLSAKPGKTIFGINLHNN